MNINVHALLTLLGVKVERKLSEPQPCPACLNPYPTLLVTQDPILQTPYFHCTQCGVRGDALDLTMRATDQSLATITTRFDNTGDLHVCIEGPTNPAQSWARFLRARDSVHNVLCYLRAGHARLHDRDHVGSGVLDVLKAEGWVVGDGDQGLPKALGYYDPDEAPSSLTIAYRPRKRENYLFAAYTYNHLLTCLEVRPVSDLSNVLHRAHKFTDRGVFNEQALAVDRGPVLLVAPNVYATTLLSTRYSAVFGTELPIICTLGLPLPQSAQHVRRIVLLDLADFPLTLGKLVPWLQSEFWQRSQHTVAVQVARASATALLTVGELDSMLSEPDRFPTLRSHLIDEIREHFERTGTYTLRKELSQDPMTEEAAHALLQLLEEAEMPEALVLAFRNFWDQCTSSINLASGSQVLVTPAGFVGIRPSGERVQLSNTTFEPVGVAIGEDQELFYRCRIMCENVSTVFEHWLPRDVFSSSDTLQSAIATILAVAGVRAYVAFYKLRGFAFPELLSAMARKLTPRPAVSRMGVVSAQFVWFPGFTVKAGKRGSGRRVYATVPDCVSSAYAALDRGAAELDDTFPALWRAPDVGHGAYVLGICHFLYCVLIAHNRVARSQPRQTHHLIYADLDAQLWVGTVTALWQTFAADGSLPQLSSSSIARELAPYAALGDLPYIGQLVTPQAKQSVSYATPVPTILATHASIAMAFNAQDRVSFVCLPPTGAMLPVPPSDELCARVRAQIPALLEFLLHPDNNVRLGSLLSFPVPASAMYRALGGIMGWECSDAVSELGAVVCHAGAENTVSVFLRHLKEFLDKRPFLLGSETLDALPHAAVCVHGGAAYIRKRCTTWLNAEYQGLNFQHRALTYMLQVAKLLVTDTEQYWMLRQSDWELYTSDEPAQHVQKRA